MAEFNQQQYADILALRSNCVLTEVYPAGLDPDAVMVSVFCSDGHRFDDAYTHKRSVQKCRIHPLSLNGGAQLLSEACPANHEFPWHRGLPDMIRQSCELKSTNLVALGSHWPCAVAEKFNLSVDDVLVLTLHGRLVLKRQYPDLEVYTFFHVVHADGRHRSYTVDHKHPHFANRRLLADLISA
ncbi:MAG: hypothetical protein AAB619_02895 [Patescibacteria group bacterium]